MNLIYLRHCPTSLESHEMFSLRVNKRIFLREEIILDDSAREICYTPVADWRQVGKWHKGISKTPVCSEWKSWLRDHIYTGAFFSAYIIENPTIAIYRWPNKEQRWFLVTRNGNLIEAQDSSLWDSCFPCIFAEETGFSIRVPQESVRLHKAENIIYFPNQTNFTHFLIDSFAPLAQLDELESKNISDAFAVPLIGNQPRWQSEYLDKIAFRKARIDEEDDRCSLILIRPDAVVFPLFSNKPAAYVPLRNFLYKRSNSLTEMGFSVQELPRPLLLTRGDYRRARIRNIDRIEAIVRSHGGLVINPSRLNIEDRFRIIGNSGLCIAEGSGATNSLIYGGNSSLTLDLLDPKALTSIDLLVGGWPYLIHQSHATQFLVGDSRVELEGSPLGCACYEEDAISETLINSLKNSST